jgi:hypothetical protein
MRQWDTTKTLGFRRRLDRKRGVNIGRDAARIS